MPRRYGVSIRRGGGSVDPARGRYRRRITLHTSGGSISAKNVTGNVEMRTSGGSVHVDTIGGDVDADTSAEDVHLLNIDGKIRREYERRRRALQPRGHEPWNFGHDLRWQHRIEPAARHDRQHRGDDEWESGH